MDNLKNGTLNYFLTKDLDALENRENALKEMNKMDPTYPDPNDPRFTDPAPVFTILDNQLYRDGVAIGKIYDNKTGKVVEVTGVTNTEFKYQDTNEDAIITKDISISVVEKLTGTKGVVETKLVVYYDIQDISSPTTIFTNYGSNVKSIEVDGTLLDSVVTTYQFDNVGEHVIKYEFNNSTVGNSTPLFNNLTTIKRVVIADTFTSIDNVAFLNCSGLTSVTIGNNVTSININAFTNCTSLTNITIPDNVISIGNNAFDHCSSLSIANINASEIGDYAFTSCSGLTSVTIGSSVTSIGNYAFAHCNNFTSITIGSSVTSIGSYAFWECNALRSITIPNSVISISDSAFQSCMNLTSAIIGSGVTSIDVNAFFECSGLTSITVEATTPPTLGSNAFYTTNNCPIYVPAESVDTYKAASGWTDYVSRIQAI